MGDAGIDSSINSVRDQVTEISHEICCTEVSDGTSEEILLKRESARARLDAGWIIFFIMAFFYLEVFSKLV